MLELVIRGMQIQLVTVERTKDKVLCCFVVAVPVEGLKSQRCFDELRTSYIKELDRLASHRGETTRTQRLFQLTQLLDYLQSVTGAPC